MKSRIALYFITGIYLTAMTMSGCSKQITETPCKKIFGSGKVRLNLATGSPGELGLLEKLADEFNSSNDTSICWMKAGSGKSLKLLKAGKVDIVMVHAPAAEKQALKDGWAFNRTLLGSNEFYIVGPKNDPAGIKNAKSASDAYKRISSAEATFLSRGDNSGTHKKELAIWKKAGVATSGSWYVITKDFMMATLKKANQIKGYFMTDSSTWVAGKKGLDNIDVLFRGDPFLINTYHALCIPSDKARHFDLSMGFIKLLASGKGQSLIGDFGKAEYGEPMYNNALIARKYAH